MNRSVKVVASLVVGLAAACSRSTSPSGRSLGIGLEGALVPDGNARVTIESVAPGADVLTLQLEDENRVILATIDSSAGSTFAVTMHDLAGDSQYVLEAQVFSSASANLPALEGKAYFGTDGAGIIGEPVLELRSTAIEGTAGLP